MKAEELYVKLKSDFFKEGITDVNWADRMPGCTNTCEDFNRSGMGLMCDFAEKIEKVLTTVFLSDNVLTKVLSSGVTNALIFSHHPTCWDIRNHNGTYAANEEYIARLRERSISIYVLHHPLNNYGEYSTCKTLADSVNMKSVRPAFVLRRFCG